MRKRTFLIFLFIILFSGFLQILNAEFRFLETASALSIKDDLGKQLWSEKSDERHIVIEEGRTYSVAITFENNTSMIYKGAIRAEISRGNTLFVLYTSEKVTIKPKSFYTVHFTFSYDDIKHLAKPIQYDMVFAYHDPEYEKHGGAYEWEQAGMSKYHISNNFMIWIGRDNYKKEREGEKKYREEMYKKILEKEKNNGALRQYDPDMHNKMVDGGIFECVENNAERY